MGRYTIGFIIGFILAATLALAENPLEIGDTITFKHPLDKRQVETLNYILKKIILRLNLPDTDITTSAPNSSRRGGTGEMVIYNNSGTYELWVNTTGAQVWQKIGP